MSLEDVLVVMAQTFQKYSGGDGKTGELNQSELANLVKAEFPKLTECGKAEEMTKTVMSLMDVDGDKKVTYQEYAIFLALLSMEIAGCGDE